MKNFVHFVKTSVFFVVKNPLLLLILLLFAFSCTQNFTREEMFEYIKNPKHGLLQEKTINNITISLTYRPSDLLAWQEIQAEDTLTKDRIKEIRNRYNQQYYFLLSISAGGKEILSSAADRQWFSGMVNQLAFGMNEKVNLVSGKDTLRLLDYNYPRMYGMSPSTDILFAFEKKKTSGEEIIFMLKDIGLMTGDTKFKFKTKKLNSTPKLKFDR